MRGAVSDDLFIAKTFARAGILKPTRPDRALRVLLALHRFGATLAADYIGSAPRYPEAVGILDERGALTFDEIERRSNALARGLADYGIRPADRVAVMCRNHRGFVETSIALSKLGAHAVYLNTSFAGPQISEVVDREAPVAVVYDQEFTEVVRDACAGRQALVAWSKELEPGASLTDEQLKGHIRDNLARYKVPRDIEFVEALPRNATGKILKRQLT